VTLAVHIAQAIAVAQKRGEELFGYAVRDGGGIIPYTRPRGLGDVLAPALDGDPVQPPATGRGALATEDPAQGSLL
jgi:hypothetical protein